MTKMAASSTAEVAGDMAGDSHVEYAVQHFGFTPQSFADGVFNVMVDNLYDTLDAAEQYLMSKYRDVPKEEVKAGTQEIILKFLQAFKKAFDKLELYLLSNLFRLPDHVLLPEDKVQMEQYTPEEEAQLDEELDVLRQKIRNAVYVNTCLKQELEDLGKVQLQMERLLVQVAEIERTCSDAGVHELKEAIVFRSSKVTALVDVVMSVMAHGGDTEHTQEQLTDLERKITRIS
ncbi:protein MIS12 homolog [Branchiostoma floridae]|uniref:Protein MIS12 homolog n=1 Tax=Branchiostoma floridae TaxID=7739 RepID=A0A9J7M3C2_BRAFL|nr:protein MIS12 homolog [Branchiostoma floridae]